MFSGPYQILLKMLAVVLSTAFRTKDKCMAMTTKMITVDPAAINESGGKQKGGSIYLRTHTHRLSYDETDE